MVPSLKLEEYFDLLFGHVIKPRHFAWRKFSVCLGCLLQLTKHPWSSIPLALTSTATLKLDHGVLRHNADFFLAVHNHLAF